MDAWQAIRRLPEGAAAAWYHGKVFVEHMIGFSHDALHVIVGVCLQLLVAAAWRRTVGSLAVWLVVLVAEIANEAADLWLETWPEHAMQWGESAKDVLLTMAMPTVLLVVARRRPQLFGARPRRRDSA